MENTYATEAEELEVLTEGTAQTMRQDRDRLLAECDWVVVKAQEEGVAVPAEWVTYRQALRDITDAEGWPLTHTWPDKP